MQWFSLFNFVFGSWAALSSGVWDVHERGAGWRVHHPQKTCVGKKEGMLQSSVIRPWNGT
jgi:hypothetical protein